MEGELRISIFQVLGNHKIQPSKEQNIDYSQNCQQNTVHYYAFFISRPYKSKIFANLLQIITPQKEAQKRNHFKVECGYQKQDTRNVPNAEIYLNSHISDILNQASVRHAREYYKRINKLLQYNSTVVFLMTMISLNTLRRSPPYISIFAKLTKYYERSNQIIFAYQLISMRLFYIVCYLFDYIVLSYFKYMKNQSANSHQLRISLDLRSLKQHQFTAQLSLRYKSNTSLGLPSFRSPSIPITNARAEVQLKDCFQSGYFQTSASQMNSRLSQGIEIELWHNDRLKSDTLLGKVQVDLGKILEMPLRTTSESYARVLDAYLPIDETNSQGRPVKTIGSLRVIAYLQDLGPIGQLQQRGFNIREFIQQAEENNPNVQNQPLQSQKNMPQNAGLNQLERKVVWQLQTWKKAEEAKARLTLKQKQIQFWTNISEQQRKSDLEKQKQFKKLEANLVLLQGKLRSKLAELAKREQKLLTLQQELQTKIVEVSRECLGKDQEIQSLKRKHKQDKTSVIKQKAQVEVELAKMRAENARLRVQAEQLRKQDDKSPLNILKSELNAKNLQIKELSRELQKANEVKEQYKVYYGKMKEEVISLRQKLRNYEESCHELLRDKKILQNNYSHLQQQLVYQRQIHQQQAQRVGGNQYREEWDEQDHGPTNDRERLIQQKEKLISEGFYTINDPLIQELDRQIRQLA